MLKKYIAVFSVDSRLITGLIFFFNVRLLIVSEYSQDFCLEWFGLGRQIVRRHAFHLVSSFDSAPQVARKNVQGYYLG